MLGVAEGFTPHRKNKSTFCAKVLEELGTNKADLRSVEELRRRAETVFQKGLEREASYAVPSIAGLEALERRDILGRRIVGREDVDIARLVQKLSNSDWVKQGLGYVTESEGLCPFCQQDLPDRLVADLEACFDETYASDLAEVVSLITAYKVEAARVQRELEALLAEPGRYLDKAALGSQLDLLKSTLDLNSARIEAKRREPSSVVSLDAVAEIGVAIQRIVEAANKEVEVHNKAVADIAGTRATLTAEIWRCVLEERKTDIETWRKTSSGLQKAIDGLKAGVRTKTDEKTPLVRRLAELEKNVTSVKPTVDEINRVLTSFGFTSFRLAVAGEHDDMYRIVREDGSEAATTLSEGERSFITFLYFYHLLAGSTSATGTTGEKVVVFDDPVSSLDSDVLFIVSTLIRKVIEDVCKDRGSVRQVFVLTHNIYFHKEVSYDRSRALNACLGTETFWVVRKRDNTSSVKRYEHNPVRTSYEMLWGEVRNAERPNLTIQNTLRRIVENYLIVLGGLKPDEIVKMFEGRDQQICASLFSWINDGSHSAHDDLYLAADDAAVQGYLRVFREIFHKTGHGAHYAMMMKDAGAGGSVQGGLAVEAGGRR